MGFNDALYKKRLPYESDAAIQFADESMEAISYYTIQASANLAVERGAYSSFKGSLRDQGILPIDSIKLLADNRGQYLQQAASERSAEHTSELQSLMRTSYAVSCLNKTSHQITHLTHTRSTNQ